MKGWGALDMRGYGQGACVLALWGTMFTGAAWCTWRDARPGRASAREMCSRGATLSYADLWGRRTGGEGGRWVMGPPEAASWRKLRQLPKLGTGAASRGAGRRGREGLLHSQMRGI